MAQSSSKGIKKKLVKIDIVADTLCHWCFVGKRNLDKAIALSKDQYDFEIRWHPCILTLLEMTNDYDTRWVGLTSPCITARIAPVFKSLGLQYKPCDRLDDWESGPGSLDSHRLVYFAGQQGLDKQHNLVEELFLGCLTKAKYIGDRKFLVESATKVGLVGAAEFLEDPGNGLMEVDQEIGKYTVTIQDPYDMDDEIYQKFLLEFRAIPYYVINDTVRLSGGQPPHIFLNAFQNATSGSV